jgi:acyl-CoA reductase-like NAD-dependent aldehyde dehydrogenase
MVEMPARQRSEILSRSADLLRKNRQDLVRTIAADACKAVKFAGGEVHRAISTFTFAKGCALPSKT